MDKQIKMFNQKISSSQESSTLRKRFTEEEDNLLKYVIQTLGIRNWSEVAKHLPGRTGRQCRDRYNNYLFKDISFRPWSEEEDSIILNKYLIYGNHWAKISTFLVGRSGNNVKNRWHKYLSKRYGEYLIKPNYHIPTNPNPIKVLPIIQVQPPPQYQLVHNSPFPNTYAVQITYFINQNSYE